MFADVTSANIVGYATQNQLVKDKFYIFGSQFDGIGGGKKINDVIGSVKGVDWDAEDIFLETASQIQLPKPGGYSTYFYLNDGWYDDGTEEGSTKPGWCDAGGVIIEDIEITPGVAFWFKNKTEEDSSWNQSGEVPNVAQVRVEVPVNFQLRNFPFPMSAELNSAHLDNSEMTGVDWDAEDIFLETAPQIQIPKTGGYSTYFYLNDGWYDDGTEEGSTKPGWCDAGGVIADVAVPVGQGFWTKGVSAPGWITFKK